MGANIGVLFGLLLLVVELRQTNDLAEANAYRARGDEVQLALHSIALSGDFAEIMVKVDAEGIDALSAVETERYRRYLWASVFRQKNQFNDYRFGFLDEYSYQAMLSIAASQYHWWEKLDIPISDPEFKHAVEAKIKELQADEY